MGDTLRILAETAAAWGDPEYGPRKEAVERTLLEPNRFSEAALAFAINQQMGLITEEALGGWLSDSQSGREPVHVGVIEAGNVPFAGLQDYLAVIGTGHHFVGAVSSKSPWLLQLFAEDVEGRGGPRAQFVDHTDLVEVVDALIASGTDETIAQLDEACQEQDIPALLRGNRYSVAVLDGLESEEDRLGLAEDALLHEGLGCRNVALVFAPDGLDADPYFDAFSVFRGTFPAHPDSSGTLKMQQAFLTAVQAPHAYGEGLVYLVSRGEAEVQSPGHVRWVPIGDEVEAADWIAANADHIQVVSARSAVGLRLKEKLGEGVAIVEMGEAQRPPLDWTPDGRDTLAFLRAL